MNRRAGYTLVELLVFIAITAVVVVAFVSILVFTVQLQARQSSSATVQEESTALLQQIQNYVANASLVSIPMNTPTSTLVLRMSSPSDDPTTITLANGTVYVKQGSGAAEPLTSNRVVISNLKFTRHANPPAHDSVDVAFTTSENTNNIKQLFSEAFQTTVTQASAASFDSNIVPSSTNTYSLGVAGSAWTSVNNVIYFNGSNVGIGTNAPLAPLQVSNGDVFISNPGSGVVLRDPSGGCWKVTVNASGTLGDASVSCSNP